MHFLAFSMGHDVIEISERYLNGNELKYETNLRWMERHEVALFLVLWFLLIYAAFELPRTSE